MAFPLLALVPSLLKTVAKFAGIDAGSILTKAADTLENITIPPEKQAEMQKELARHEEAMEAFSVEKLKATITESVAMIQSQDKWVSRARPTGLYIAYLAGLAMVVAVIIGVQLDPALVLELILPMYGAQGYYMHLRTKEKMNGNGDGD